MSKAIEFIGALGQKQKEADSAIQKLHSHIRECSQEILKHLGIGEDQAILISNEGIFTEFGFSKERGDLFVEATPHPSFHREPLYIRFNTLKWDPMNSLAVLVFDVVTKPYAESEQLLPHPTYRKMRVVLREGVLEKFSRLIESVRSQNV